MYGYFMFDGDGCLDVIDDGLVVEFMCVGCLFVDDY